MIGMDTLLLRRPRRLSYLMPRLDAFRLWWHEQAPGEIQVRLKPIDRDVTIRGATTDMNCLEKVFFQREYQLPFDVSPEVIVDAGANIGMATLWFAAAYPNARIFAIEPETANFKQLLRNCAGLPNVHAIQAAVWPTSGDLMIANLDGNADAFSVSEAKSGSRSETVRAITLDELISEYRIDRLDLLKLDIEGAEYELFSANCSAWLDRVNVLAIELHDRFRPGCGKAFYSEVVKRQFWHETKGENVFLRFTEAGSR